MTAELAHLPPVRREDRLSGRRRNPSSISEDLRSDFERDLDRVIYNFYFRRLAEVTQVSSGSGQILRHNRMTHSYKVGQVGRRLVQYLLHDPANETGVKAAGGIDGNVVNAAGLLHDIGHPPFGHVGEEELDRLARAAGLADGFEGNAQTLRIILSLANHHRAGEGSVSGLDLTRAVVASCVKYPWSSSDPEAGVQHKWGYYEPDAETFNRFVRPLLPAPRTPTLEAEVMDWADDITYAVHDLQDFYLDGVIPLHHLRHRPEGSDYEPVDSTEFNDFWHYVSLKLQKTKRITPTVDARREFGKYAAQFPKSKYSGAREEEAAIGALASRIITDASKAVRVTTTGHLYVRPRMKAVVNALKYVTWYYVIDHPDLVSTQIGQRARVKELFQTLTERVEWCFRQEDEDGQPLNQDEQWRLQRRLPVRLREFTHQLLAANNEGGAYEDRRKCYIRAVIDYIASMTEVEFARMWDSMGGGVRY